MTIQLPYTISQGDTTNQDKIESNFRHLEDKLNNEAYSIPSMADADAPNNSLYFSTTASKLVWKDNSGNVQNLY